MIQLVAGLGTEGRQYLKHFDNYEVVRLMLTIFQRLMSLILQNGTWDFTVSITDAYG